MSLATLDVINKAKERALKEKQEAEKKAETVESPKREAVEEKPVETSAVPVEKPVVETKDDVDWEAKYKELKKVYTVDAKHKIEFFDSRYNFINDDTTPNTKTIDDIIPTADKTYNVVLNPNVYARGIGCLPKFNGLKDGDIITLTLNDQWA